MINFADNNFGFYRYLFYLKLVSGLFSVRASSEEVLIFIFRSNPNAFVMFYTETYI